MRRFGIRAGTKVGDLVPLDVKESHHALHVLRIKVGEVVELIDGKGALMRGVVASVDKRAVMISVTDDSVPTVTEKVSVTLAVSVIKPDRMDLLVEKACELGAARIIPVISQRSVVRLSEERWKGKVLRWRKIAAESCKQCGQPTTPEVHEVVDFKDILHRFSDFDLVLIPTLAVPVKTLYDSLNSNTSARSILVLIGPEGDFSNTEALAALKAGAQAVSLGPRVLRSETAALYALSATHFFYREFASPKGL